MHRGVMGDQNAQVRADLAYFPTRRRRRRILDRLDRPGSARFPHADYENNVRPVTGNVLRRFLDERPL